MNGLMNQLREGIATNLRAIPGLQASAQFLAAPTPPSAHVFPGEITYHQTMGNGHSDWNLTVQVFVAMVSDIGAQQLLDQYVADSGEFSVLAAIESDRTLGGVADDVIVQSCSGYRRFVRDGGGEILGADFQVRVLAGS